MSTDDMTGRKVREPGKRGERYTEARERRARKSKENQEKFWAARVEQAKTPLQVFRVSVSRLSTAVVQRERRVAVEAERARRDRPGSRQDRQAQTRLEKTRAEITADLMWLSEQVLDIAARHETHRA